MTFSLISPDFWTEDVPGNAIPAVAGFLLAQGWRWSRRAWNVHRSRGAVWADLRDGVTFVFLSERQSREELRAQMTIANHCATLGIDIDPDLYYADQNLEKILSRNLVVIHTATRADAAEGSVLRGWLHGWSGAPDLGRDRGNEMSGYLVRLPNPHNPTRSIVILTGPRRQSAWAAALWLSDPSFTKDQHATSAVPFVHTVPFGLTQGVPFVQPVTGDYLTRRGQVSHA
jgi:hypothetical protein